MEKVRYMISDAANIVNVESHVLRYWEDELELNVPRNELGPVKRFSKSASELYFITFHNTNLLNKKKPVTKNAYVTAYSSTRPRIVFANNYSILPS